MMVKHLNLHKCIKVIYAFMCQNGKTYLSQHLSTMTKLFYFIKILSYRTVCQFMLSNKELLCVLTSISSVL